MYYGVSICLVSFASAMAVVTLNVHFRGLRGAEVPRSVKKIFLSGLARIVFMQFSPSFAMSEKFGGVADRSDTFEQRMRNCFKCSTTRSDTMITTGCPANNQLFKDMNGSYCTMSGAGNGAPDTTTESVINHLGDNKGPASGMLRKDNSPIFGRSSIVNRGRDCTYNNGVTDNNIGSHTCDLLNDDPNVDNVEPKVFRVLEKVSSTIDKNEERCEENDKKEQHEMEWKQVALVLDRLLLLVFFLAMTIASLVILTSSPHLKLDL